MRGSALQGLLAVACALLARGPAARAQDPPAVEEGAASSLPVEDASSAPSRTAPPIPEPPPIMVVALGAGRVAPEVLDAVRDAVIALVEPMAGGRPVRPLLAGDLQSAIEACREPACLGAQIAGAGAVGALIARIVRRGVRGPIELRLEMVDPVSGNPRLSPILATVSDPSQVGAALAPFAEQLRSAMFSPPPPPPQLLVTVNVDGATVRVDDEVVGVSPLAPIRLAPGRHVVAVQREGYLMTRREVELEMGERERLDVALQSLEAAGVEAAPDANGTGGGPSRGPEWYEHWAFWTGVGGAVALGLAIGVAVAVATSNQGSAPDPRGIPLPPIR